MRIRKLLLVGGGAAAVALASVAAAVAGAQAIRGTVQSDGSSTVAPFAQAAAESFER
jgi:ABC-type phosphate transport system substrate-binding protein